MGRNVYKWHVSFSYNVVSSNVNGYMVHDINRNGTHFGSFFYDEEYGKIDEAGLANIHEKIRRWVNKGILAGSGCECVGVVLLSVNPFPYVHSGMVSYEPDFEDAYTEIMGEVIFRHSQLLDEEILGCDDDHDWLV